MMNEREFIYLDNAATSWPKPDCVVDAVANFYRDNGVAAGRGSTQRASQADRIIDQCRVEIARLINAQAEQIIFCFNGTDGLNMAIGGMIRNGDHVVMTDTEHNSVVRPINEFARSEKISFDSVKSQAGILAPQSFITAIKQETRLICVSHVSNVTGIQQDIPAIVDSCRRSNSESFVLLDAAQSVGHIPVDVQALGCDILVAPGHKGLVGPLGTGFVYLSERAASEIRATRFGGTGTNSEMVLQPDQLPQRLESGNPNVGGIAGLLQGVGFIQNEGVDSIAAHERELADRLIESLQDNDAVELYGSGSANRTGLVSFNIRDNDPQTVSVILDNEFGIQLRAGYHCSPLMHQSLGTDVAGGTLRASVGFFNSEEHIDRLVAAINQLAGQLV